MFLRLLAIWTCLSGSWKTYQKTMEFRMENPSKSLEKPIWESCLFRSSFYVNFCSVSGTFWRVVGFKTGGQFDTPPLSGILKAIISFLTGLRPDFGALGRVWGGFREPPRVREYFGGVWEEFEGSFNGCEWICWGFWQGGPRDFRNCVLLKFPTRVWSCWDYKRQLNVARADQPRLHGPAECAKRLNMCIYIYI